MAPISIFRGLGEGFVLHSFHTVTAMRLQSAFLIHSMTTLGAVEWVYIVMHAFDVLSHITIGTEAFPTMTANLV
jgi:hypothetical protein